MDTQIKIIKEIATYGEDKLINTKEYLLNFATVHSPLFTFKESENIFLTFQFNEENLNLKYESYESDEMIPIVANERIHFSHGRNEAGCYFVGEFSIVIESSVQKYALTFKVEPNNLEYETVFMLREYVNTFYSGLSYDILKNKSGYVNNSMDKENANFYDRYILLTSKFPQLLMHISSYINMKYTISKKEQTYAHATMKLSSSSIKWLSSKGMCKNDNIYSPHILLTKKTKHELNNEQNQFFKDQLLFLDQELRKMTLIIMEYKNTVLEAIEVKTKDWNEQEVKVKNLFPERCNVSKKAKVAEKSKLDRLHKSIEELKITINIYDQYIETVKKYKSNLEYYLYNTWMACIQIPKQIMIRNKSFQAKFLQGFRSEYEGMLIYGDKGIKRSFLSEKSSPKLFEAFIFVLLINILKDMGFAFEEENDLANRDLLYLLSNPCKLGMVNEGIYCDIIYDKEMRRSNMEFIENEYCTINSFHNRPDFVLSFHKDESRGKPFTALIVEAKWRALEKIYNEMGSTDVVEALIDYYNLGYYVCEKSNADRGVIKKVIALYPDVKEQVINIQHNNILAIGLLPHENMSEQQGYINLVNEIEKSLLEGLST